MKIAVLISGEYRKFDITRKTMPFLDDINVDVYVSTWDKTIYSSPKVNLYKEEIVTEDRILRDLGRSANIKIDPASLIVKSKYNSKMINRWLAGWQLIQDSGIKYDYVMVLRTDLFFMPGSEQFCNIEKYDNSVGVLWATSLNLGKLGDMLFISSYQNISKLFNTLTHAKWNLSPETDWHKWWYSFVYNLHPSIVDVNEFGWVTFCRFWTTKNSNFHESLEIHHDWRDLRILNECDIYGNDFHGNDIWPDNIVNDAKRKWLEGYYDKYKVGDR